MARALAVYNATSVSDGRLRITRRHMRFAFLLALLPAIGIAAASQTDPLAFAAQCLVGSFLVVAAGSKLGAIGTFALRIRSLPGGRRAGTVAARQLAFAVCAAELVLGGLLVAGAQPVVTGSLILVLLAGFSAVIAAAIRTGTATPCGCLGAGSRRPPSVRDIARNAGLAALTIVAMVRAATEPAPFHGAAGSVTLLAVASGLLLAVTTRDGRRRIPVHTDSVESVIAGLRRRFRPRRDVEFVIDSAELQDEFAALARLVRASEQGTVALDAELVAAQSPPEAGRRRTLERGFEAREAKLVEVEEEVNRRFERLYAEAARSRGQQTLVRLAMLHWTVLLRRRGMASLHTAVEGLADDPDCSGDLIADGLLQTYFDAVLARDDREQGQRDAVDALVKIARQSACIGAQQSALLASDLYWSFRELRSFLRTHQLEAVVPALAQAASSPLLLFYDVEKWRGTEAPLGRWFAEQQEALGQGIATRRHPAFWHGLWLYDRRSGHLLGYQVVTAEPADENEVDLEALFASIADPINIGRGDCSFTEMIQRGAGAIGYVCAGQPCAERERTPTSSTGTTISVGSRGPSGGLLGSPALEIVCKAASPRRGGSGGCGGADLGGGWSREADLVRCLSERAVQPGEAQMRCVAEATGRCANPVDSMTKHITQALMGGVKVAPGCRLADAAPTDENVSVEVPVNQEGEHVPTHVEVDSSDPGAVLQVVLQQSAAAQQDAMDYMRGLEDAEAAGDDDLAAWMQEKFDDAMAKMHFWDSVATAIREKYGPRGKESTGRGPQIASTGRCPQDTPNCGGNACTGMSEWARRTMACFQEPAGTRHPTDPAGSGVFDPLESAGTGSLGGCFDLIAEQSSPSSQPCWYYDCGPGSFTGAGAGGCACGSGPEIGGAEGGLSGGCGMIDCSEGMPRFDGGRCSCAPPTGGGTGVVPLEAFELAPAKSITQVHVNRLELLATPRSIDGARIALEAFAHGRT